MASSEVEFLEERLVLLETWLESTNDENTDDLIQKREEYQGLIEETVLLQKKLRKTSKLLSTETSEKMLQKLAKKQDQYLCEIEEIMNYAESDVLFETAEIVPNELLGEPLETLMEHPGMEGSCASLNFSMSDFMPKKVTKAPQASLAALTNLPSDDDLHPIAENSGGASNAKHNGSMNSISTGLATLFTIATTDSNTYDYDEKTLLKKLKKVETLIEAGEVKTANGDSSPLNSRELRKLKKKRDQYKEALEIKFHNGQKSSKGSNATELQFEEDSDEQYEEQIEESDTQDDSNGNIEQSQDISISNHNSHNYQRSTPYDRKTLKKKLKKLKAMMAATSNVKELEHYKQKKKQYKIALDSLSNQETDAPLSPSFNADDSFSHHEKTHTDDDEDHKIIESMQRKIRKTDKYIAKAREEEDPKRLKKLVKKRQEYQTSLDQLLSNR